jgi:serine/threonine protein kinase
MTGEGSFAKVKLATHDLTGQTVAVKFIYKQKIKEDYVRRHLQREGRLMQKMSHPHIIQLYEIIETDAVYCLVTELAQGSCCGWCFPTCVCLSHLLHLPLCCVARCTGFLIRVVGRRGGA